jgi:ribosomal protein S18 acetylase RimI-like enzyme
MSRQASGWKAGITHTLSRVPVRVEEATAVSEELTVAIDRLVGDLSASPGAPTQDELQAIVHSSATRLLVARNVDDDVVGSLTLALVRLPTGVRAGLYDLEVAIPERQHGVAEMLIMEAVRLAHDAGAGTVDLMSDVGAYGTEDWYRRLGFKESIIVHRRELS